MQHKLPCVSSYEGAIPKIIEDGYNGLLCNPHDINSLANCLKSLINNKEGRVKMGENGLSLYETKYKLTYFENNLNSILKS